MALTSRRSSAFTARVLIVTRFFELPPSRFRAARPNSLVSPFLRWQREFFSEGIAISFASTLTALGSADFDAVIVDRRIFSGIDDYEEVIAQLNELRNRAGWIVFLDSSASSGDDHFEVLEAVDVYAKRHLLKNLNEYRNQDPALPGHFQYYRDLYSLGQTSSRKRVPLPGRFENRVKIAWSHAYSNFETPLNSRISWPVGRNFTSIRSSSNQRFPVKAREIGALYHENRSEPFAEARRQFQRLLDEAGGVVFPDRVGLRQYFAVLSKLRVNVSPYGHGEYCIRDFETLLFGVALAKPTVENLATFPNVLIAGQTYLPLSLNPALWLEEIYEASKITREIGVEGYRALRFARSREGFLIFLEHFSRCLLSHERCGDCTKLLSSQDY